MPIVRASKGGRELELREKVGAINQQRLRVEKIGAGREQRIVFRTQVEVFPVLSDVEECRDASWRLWAASRALTQRRGTDDHPGGPRRGMSGWMGWHRRAPG